MLELTIIKALAITGLITANVILGLMVFLIIDEFIFYKGE